MHESAESHIVYLSRVKGPGPCGPRSTDACSTAGAVEAKVITVPGFHQVSEAGTRVVMLKLLLPEGDQGSMSD